MAEVAEVAARRADKDEGQEADKGEGQEADKDEAQEVDEDEGQADEGRGQEGPVEDNLHGRQEAYGEIDLAQEHHGDIYDL